MARKLLFILAIIALNCQDMPQKLPYNNPFDTKNPVTNGDPFNLQAFLENDHINLTWSKIELEVIKNYHIYKAVDDYKHFDLVATNSKSDTTWQDTDISPGHSYWYKITALDEDGYESSLENAKAVRVNTNPVVVINNDTPYAFSVNVILTILAPAAVKMWISNYADFQFGTWEPYIKTKPWELLEEEGIQTVYVKVKYENGIVSDVFCDSIELDLKSPEMIYIPAGEFEMGSDKDGDLDEQPLHRIYINEFWIDKYEVTNENYARFLSSGYSDHYDPRMKIIDNGDGTFSAKTGYEFHPVIYVTWEDAKAYATWRGASLPTEAQWEKAARANSGASYPWGNSLESNRANFWESGDTFENSEPPYTTPVGYYDGSVRNGYQTKDNSSPFGVYDMAGNVWEWCADWYDANYYEISPVVDPPGPASGLYRIIRGGSWNDDPYYIRTTARSSRQPYERADNIGFRCVK